MAGVEEHKSGREIRRGRAARRAAILSAGALLASLVGVLPASAGYDDDVRDCFATGYGGAKRVSACTRVIDSGRLRGRDRAGAYQSRAEGHRIIKEYDSALADFARALEIDPQNALTYSNRAEVYRMLGKYDAVIADTTQAIKLGSKLNATYALRGVAYAQTGEIDKAREDFKRTLALPPEGADASWAQDVARRELQRLEDK
jgi:tetratricopeptide (TPR) repeat protein